MTACDGRDNGTLMDIIGCDRGGGAQCVRNTHTHTHTQLMVYRDPTDHKIIRSVWKNRAKQACGVRAAPSLSQSIRLHQRLGILGLSSS